MLKTLYEGQHLSLHKTTRGWEYITRKNAGRGVMIVAITDVQRIILIEQERIPVGGQVIDLPAGLIDPDEKAEDAAKRELWEETGYRCNTMTYLSEGTSLPGLIGEINTVWLATDMYRTSNSSKGRMLESGVIHYDEKQGVEAEGESISVYEVPLSGARGWLDDQTAQGKVINLKIYAALFFAYEALGITQ